MVPTTKKLRPYQVRLVTDVCRAAEDILVEQPTGSGKTVQIVTLVAMHLGRRFTHAVIAAPQEQIEQGFTKLDYDTVAFPDFQGVAVPSTSQSLFLQSRAEYMTESDGLPTFVGASLGSLSLRWYAGFTRSTRASAASATATSPL